MATGKYSPVVRVLFDNFGDNLDWEQYANEFDLDYYGYGNQDGMDPVGNTEDDYLVMSYSNSEEYNRMVDDAEWHARNWLKERQSSIG